MKKLLLFMCIIFSISTYSQAQGADIDSVTEQINITEAERIIDKYSGNIAESFNQGLEKITPMAIEGFEIVVRLQVAKGIFFSIVALIFLIFLIIVIKAGIKDDWEEFGMWLFFIVISSLLFCLCLYVAIVRLFVPEWFAIKEIIEMF